MNLKRAKALRKLVRQEFPTADPIAKYQKIQKTRRNKILGHFMLVLHPTCLRARYHAIKSPARGK